MNTRRWILVALVAVALAIRLAFLLTDQQPAELSSLAGTQGQIAHNILASGKWAVVNGHAPAAKAEQANGRHLIDPSDLDWSFADSHPDYAPLPLHTAGVGIITAGLWKITGDEDYIYTQLLQALIASLLTLVVYWTTMKLFNRPRAALIAAGLWAVHPSLANFMHLPFYDPWAILAALAAFGVFIKARETGFKLGWLIALGVVTGIGINFRPPLVFLPIGMAAAMIPSDGWKRAARYALVPLVVAMPFVLPWTVRNYVDYDQFIPIHTGFGQVLWQGLGEIDNPLGAHENDGLTFQLVHSERPDLKYATPEYDNYLRAKAFKAIRTHPVYWLKLEASRLVRTSFLMRNGTWTGEIGDEYSHRTESLPSWVVHNPAKAVVAGFSGLFEPVLFLAALLTLILTRRRFRESHLILVGVVLAVWLTPMLIGMEWRYVAPASFVYTILAGVGADLLIAHVAARRARKPALAVA